MLCWRILIYGATAAEKAAHEAVFETCGLDAERMVRCCDDAPQRPFPRVRRYGCLLKRSLAIESSTNPLSIACMLSITALKLFSHSSTSVLGRADLKRILSLSDYNQKIFWLAFSHDWTWHVLPRLLRSDDWTLESLFSES